MGFFFLGPRPGMREPTDKKNSCQSCNERLLDVRATASMLGISTKSIRNQLSQKRFPIPSYKFGSKRLFKLSEVLAFIENLS